MSTNTLPLTCLWVRKNWKEKELEIYLIFPFLLHHFQHKWLVNTRSNMNKKGYDRIPWSYVFLNATAFFFLHWIQLLFEWNNSSQGPLPCPITHRCNMFALFYIWVLLSSQAFWILWNTRIMGHLERYMWMHRTADVHIVPISGWEGMLHCPLKLPLQSTNSKVEVLRTSRWWQQVIKPSLGPFWAWDPVQLYMLHVCEADSASETSSINQGDNMCHRIALRSN